jgi:hypothetical protein
MSSEMAVMLSPQTAFRRLLVQEREPTWLQALRRPAFVALLLGSSVAISATSSITLSVVVSLTAWWAFAVAIQIIAAIILVASAPHRRISLARGVDLLFAGHAPWSLWLLFAAIPGLSRSLSMDALLATTLVPGLWTTWIVFAFSRGVLDSNVRHAVLRTMLHQGIIWVFVWTCVLLAIGAWPRLLSLLQR